MKVAKKAGISTISVGLSFIGKSGEYYRIVVYMGKRRVPSPKLQFLHESGKPLQTASFEYG